ncbi:MAG: hypothetical protein AAB556_02525 [Patescibacteria group bacterium]
MIIVTTAISGSGEMEHLERVVAYAEKMGKKAKIFNVADLFFEQAQKIGIRISKEKVLNTRRQTMAALQSSVSERIVADLVHWAGHDSLAIINVHATFYRRGIFKRGFSSYYLSQFNADAYINLLSDSEAVFGNLSLRPQWNFLFGNRNKSEILKKIMTWQSDEVKDTEGWAEREQKNFFVIPTRSSPEVIYRIIFEPWRKIFYLGMPITHLHDEKYAEARNRINCFAEWLRKHVILIDPRHVEPLTPEMLAQIDKEIYHQVVERDLEWLIPQCNGIIAFHPEVIVSAGVNNETREVFETNGESFLIYPYDKKSVSPFLIEWTDEIVFKNEDEFKPRFLEYLGKDYLAKVEEAEKCYNRNRNG